MLQEFIGHVIDYKGVYCCQGGTAHTFCRVLEMLLLLTQQTSV